MQNDTIPNTKGKLDQIDEICAALRTAAIIIAELDNLEEAPMKKGALLVLPPRKDCFRPRFLVCQDGNEWGGRDGIKEDGGWIISGYKAEVILEKLQKIAPVLVGLTWDGNIAAASEGYTD